MIHSWYAAAAESILATLWLNNPMKAALLKPGFVPNTDTQKVWTDISASELAASGGYTAGGVTLANKSTPYDAPTDRTDLIADDVTWGPAATFDAAYAVIYDSSGTKPLWSLVDFQGTKSVSNGSFLLDFAAAGLLYLIPA